MASPRPRSPWPTELRFQRARKVLLINFDDGEEFVIPYSILRSQSPSAEVTGHGAKGRAEPVSSPKDHGVDVLKAELVGRYAARITFDDGHNTGLYTWPYLRTLAERVRQAGASARDA